MLLTDHNINFYQEMMKQIRLAIERNKFNEFEEKFLTKRLNGDLKPL